MSRTYGKAQDLIDFTRASSGTALRRVKYGAELVQDTGFDDPSYWLTGGESTVSGGIANVLSTAGVYSDVRKDLGLNQTSVYVLQYEIVGTPSGPIGLGNDLTDANRVIPSTVGTHTVVFRSALEFVAIKRLGACDIDITSISVKEVTFDTSDGDLVLFNHPNNIPRIEYDANGNLLGLLVEESRTNIIRYSENFSLWSTNGSITRTISSTPSPDGQLNAYDVVDSGSGDEFIARYDTIPTTVTTYVSTVFAKKTSGDSHYLNIANFIYGGSGQYLHATFNTNTGEFTAVSGISISETFVEDRGSYWRIGIKVTNTGSNNTLQVRLYPAYNSDGGTVRNASTAGSKTLFGVQLEAGSFPTSYIPNYGTSGGVTRSADVASLSTSAFGYRQDEGTIVTEAATFDSDITQAHVIADLHDGTTNNRVLTQARDAVHLSTRVSGSTVVTIDAGTYVSGQYTKQASVVKAGSYACALDGGSVVTDTASSIPASATTFSLGINSANSVSLNGHIKSIKYYPRRLTNDQLVEVTS